MFKKLNKNKATAFFPSGSVVTDSLPKLLVSLYGFDHFSVFCDSKSKNSFVFDFNREFYEDSYNSSFLTNIYDSVFYCFVSMVLTRSERDKFIKIFRRS